MAPGGLSVDINLGDYECGSATIARKYECQALLAPWTNDATPMDFLAALASMSSLGKRKRTDGEENEAGR